MKRTVLTVFLLAVTHIVASGDPYSVALTFMDPGHDPVSSALAGASILRAPDRSDVSVSYQKWNPSSTSYISAAADLGFGKRLRVRAGGTYGAGTAYEILDRAGRSDGTFTPSDMMFGAGATYLFGRHLGFTLNGRYASSSIAEGNKHDCFALDIMLDAVFGDFKFAAGAVNIDAMNDRFSIPTAYVLAVSYDNGDGSAHRFRPEIDAKYYCSGCFSLSAGIDYCMSDFISFRAGCHFGGIVADHFSAGVGVKVRGVHIDASYLYGNGPIRNTFSLGAGFSF